MIVLFALVISLNLASAVIVNSVSVQTLAPGQEGNIMIELKNNLNDDAEDISLNLKFTNLPFIPIGTSEQSVDEITESDDENFVFRIKASPTISPGDYEIPYTLEYKVNTELKVKTGSIGVKVTANPILDYGITTENPVINQQGKIALKVVNKGFSNARFLSVKVLPEDFTLLSEKDAYIGEIQSDDFDTATFDVIFTKTSPQFTAIIEYIDFDNKKIIENIQLPFSVYTKERATELGIVKKSNLSIYISLIVLVIFLIILWRILKKRQRLKKSRKLEEER